MRTIRAEEIAWSEAWKRRLGVARANGDMDEALRLRNEDADYYGFGEASRELSVNEERRWWKNQRRLLDGAGEGRQMTARIGAGPSSPAMVHQPNRRA